jgi:CRISPR-associated protein Csb1
VRFSTLGPRLHEAFEAYKERGDAEPLARIAPTSIVFGSWDSRGTQVKLPRIVRSVIRAYNVKELTRSAQYSTIAGEILNGGNAEVTTRGPKAELGLAHVPAVKTLGGVSLQNDASAIRREAILNLTALRAVGGSSKERTRLSRRYVLGLALVSLTAPMDSNLREGCELVPDADRATAWTKVKRDGTRTDLVVTHEDALEFATLAAAAFQVDARITATFQSDLANAVLQLDEKTRKQLLREGQVTMDAIELVKAKPRAAAARSKA